MFKHVSEASGRVLAPIAQFSFILLFSIAVISCSDEDGDDPLKSDPMAITLDPPTGYHGEVVTIKGTNFRGTPGITTVSFNGGTASIQSITANEMIVSVPYGAKSGMVTVSYYFEGASVIHKSVSDFTLDLTKPKFTGGVRASSATFTINNKAYMGTGFANGSAKKDLWEMDPTTMVWTQKADLPGIERSGGFGFSIGSKGYIGGGSNNSVGNIVDFYEYDPATNQWTAKAPLILELTYAASFAINGRGYIVTGAGDFQHPTTALYEYDPTLNQWKSKAAFPGAARIYASSFVINNKAYVTGGFGEYFVSTADDINLTDLWEYDPSNDSWVQKANLPVGRVASVGFAINGKGYIGLGFLGKKGTYPTASHTNGFWSYNPSTNMWTEEANLKGAPRSFAFSFVLGNSAYIGGGNDYYGYYDDVRVYPNQ